jgi:hypothetical protein
MSFRVVFFLGVFSGPEDGGNMFLRNVGSLSTDYTALYPRKQNSLRSNFSNASLVGGHFQRVPHRRNSFRQHADRFTVLYSKTND